MSNILMAELTNLVHVDIAQNPDVINIELGAGCGDFGAKFYPDCFLTDQKLISDLKRECDKCHVTICCDAHSIPSDKDRFEMIIMCNPYGYGFKDSAKSIELLDELYRVARNDAKILILTSWTNKYSAPERVEKRIKTYNRDNNYSRFTYTNTPINCEEEYPDYIFYNIGASKQTFPNHKILLECHKP